MENENSLHIHLNNEDDETKVISHAVPPRSSLESQPHKKISFLKALFSRFSKKPIPVERHIQFNGTVSPPVHVPNLIKNQKYNILTFIPIVLFNQFKFFFNLFFLLTALSQLYPPFQTGYLVSYVGPLSLVLILTMLKEAYDDFERYKRDKEANSTKYFKLTGSHREQVPSSKLKVGDIIEVHANQRIPADLILLWTNEPNGSVFLKTDQLDGETDWKVRKAIRYLQAYVTEKDNFVGLENKSKIIANPPIIDIYKFEGVFETEKNGEIIKESLSLENTLWGSTILAAGTVYGMVLYTGKEMRVVMNTISPRTKVGMVEDEVNILSKVLFFVLAAIALGMVGLQGFQSDWLVQFIRFMILLSSIIPISLRVNLDFSKLTYCRMINTDKDIPGTLVRNRSVPEELGRLQFLLTDKTGTLTQNEMIFKKLALENGDIYTEEKITVIRRILRRFSARGQSQSQLNRTEISTGTKESIIDSRASLDQNHTESIVAPPSRLQNSRDIKEKLVNDVIMAIALCHNVTPVIDEGERVFQASSPDEIALVETVELLGMKLVTRDQDSITIEDAGGCLDHYDILANFPFSSESKRMGIILKNRTTEKIVFYLKGADTVMKDRVPQRQRGYLLDMCETLAAEGLRTLVIAEKYLTEEEFAKWKVQYDAATQSLTDRQERIRKVVESLEVNMKFLGITGVEDKLQEDVMHTLENLRGAGIKVWMLTGDKIETAKTIAISAGIKAVEHQFFTMKDMTDPVEVQNKLLSFGNLTNGILVIDGTTLEIALDSCYKIFFECTAQAPGVVCCRCSPTQKTIITEGVKKITGKKTCAIGDGGNDVGMISAADVGIGIEGKEGKQAALAADYSIMKFKYLNKLLLWHGRLSYKRSAMMAHFVIHRGLIISFIQAFFSIVFYDLSISIYTGILNLGYTTLYTFFPVFSIVFDEDIDVKRALRYPPLYKTLQKGRELSLKNFFIWLWRSLYQAFIIMFLALYLFDNSYYNIVTITFAALILSELLNVTTTLHRISWVAVVSIASSLGLYIMTIVFLKKDINASTITLQFLYKVTALTLVSWLPIHSLKVLRTKLRPTEQERIMMGAKLLKDTKTTDHFL